ncbi:MAG: exo-alpha-sialidase [Bacteroidales bacterium]|nr:exo-alpha-sialidase [Bacteroidales bacterium]
MKNTFVILMLALACAGSAFAADKDSESSPEIRRSRIAWDRSTITKVMQPGNYGRIRDLGKGHLIAVASSGTGIGFTSSHDNGLTWEKPRIIVQGRKELTMSVPEIIQLKNGNLLLTYNPRPAQPNDNVNLKYGIRARISSDLGQTWSDEIFVFDAQHYKRQGCWEPFALELPSGQIQIFFANENDYPDSNDQNISMCRSFDGGYTWSETKMVSQRKKSRDGMPVALYLKESGETIVAIENNGFPGHTGRMQPAIIRLQKNWKGPFVGFDSPYREYALAEPLDRIDNAGAPYICRARTGEVLLSYQGTENRDVPLLPNKLKSIDNTQEMFVAVGDSAGRGFTNRSTPFSLPLGPGLDDKNGYKAHWNSLTSLKSGEILAVTSSNAFEYPKSGVFSIKGYLMADEAPARKTVKLDGFANEWKGACPSAAIAQKLSSRLYTYVAKDSDNLYFTFVAKGLTELAEASAKVRKGFELHLSPKGSSDMLHASISFKAKLQVTGNGAFVDDFSGAGRLDPDGSEFVFECSMPLKDFGDAKEIMYTLKLFDTVDGTYQSEDIPGADLADKSTWLKILL